MKKTRKPKLLPSAQFYAELVADMDTQLNLQDNEEFKKSVEHYEKSIERRSTIEKAKIQCTVGSTLSQPAAGILKISRSCSSGANDGNKDIHKKPISSGFIPLGDKDIVIIDNAEIQETIKHGADIIVVDKTRDGVDLVELLGSNWPKPCGDTKIVFNQKLNNFEKYNDSLRNNSIQTNAKQTSVKNVNRHHTIDSNKDSIEPGKYTMLQ